MRILFMGSPVFCAEFLNAIPAEHDIVGVITKSDNPRRKIRLSTKSSPKWFALKNSIILMQPDELNERLISRAKRLKPDIILVIAYGRKLPVELLKVPGKGCVNIHFSMLPEYRGAAPARWAMLNGETETGVTSMFMDENIDTGGIIARKKVRINIEDNYKSLMGKLVSEGCYLMLETLSMIKSGKVKQVPQDLTGSYKCAPIISKKDSKINWNDTAVEIYNKIRAFCAEGAWVEIRSGDGAKKVLKILAAEPPLQDSSSERNYKPGHILEMKKDSWVAVKCGKGCLRVSVVRAESRARCCAYDYLLGARLKRGDNIIYVK